MIQRVDYRADLANIDRVIDRAIQDLSRMEDEQNRYFPIRAALERLTDKTAAQVAAYAGGERILERLGNTLRFNFGLLQAGIIFKALAEAVREGEITPSYSGPTPANQRGEVQSHSNRLNSLFVEELPSNLRYYGATHAAVNYLEKINPGSRRIAKYAEKIRALDRLGPEMSIVAYGEKDLLQFAEEVLFEFGLIDLRNQIRSAVLQSHEPVARDRVA